jgi:sec-independent protein translocase protein TatB
MQMEEELRVAEQADRQKQIAAMEAAAPVTPSLPAETADAGGSEQQIVHSAQDDNQTIERESLPIAVSGDLKIMPPATGLPQARGEGAHHNGNDSHALDGLLDSIPVTTEEPHAAEEGAAHGD